METCVIETRSIGSRQTAVMVAELDVEKLGNWLPATYSRVAAFLADSGKHPAGPPFARYHRLEGERFRVEAGFPVDRAIVGVGDVRRSSLPGGTVAIATHIGPYESMEATYEALAKWIDSRGSVPSGDAWEVYFSDESDPPSSWHTDIVQPYQTI